MNGVAQRYFENLYSRNPDPWRGGERWYEIRKRNMLLAALPHHRFAHAYEPGCGTGELTAELANRCDRVLATDFSENAVGIARHRMRYADHVDVQLQAVPQEWPWPGLAAASPQSSAAGGVGAFGHFDLIVISEFAYYLPDESLHTLAALATATLADDGCLVACHWRHDFEERVNTTDAVHAAFDHQPGLCRIGGYRDADFLLDIWSASGPRAGIRASRPAELPVRASVMRGSI